MRADTDGMSVLFSRLPSLDAAVIDTAADGWARHAKAGGDPRRLGQLRAAALLDWAERYLGHPAGPRRRGRPLTVHPTIDLPTYLGLTDHPGEILPGALIPADALRELLPDAELRRLITDPTTGHLLDYGKRSYRPPAPLAAYLTARDVTSTGPTSTAPAGRGDLDHLTAYTAGGRTNPANLHSPDRRWHRAKTRGGWAVTRNRDHTLTWTSPAGRRYHTAPHDYRLGP